jgi:hypothetical protein
VFIVNIDKGSIIDDGMATTNCTEEFTDYEENDFEKIHLIGRGGISHIYLVKHEETGLICTMKKISKS